MPEIPLGFAQVTHRFGGPALDFGAAVTYGVQLDFSAPIATIALGCHNAWGAEIQPELSNAVDLLETLVKAGPPESGPSFIHADTITGGRAEASISPNVTLLVRKQTALGGRIHRGRFYVPGLTEPQVNQDGTLTPAIVATFGPAFEAFRVAVNGVAGVTTMQLLHSNLLDDEGNEIPGSAAAPDEILSLEVDGRAATQRRRLRR